MQPQFNRVQTEKSAACRDVSKIRHFPIAIKGTLSRGRAFALLKMAREGEAPAEPQTMESVLLLAAQQELRPPGQLPILKRALVVGRRMFQEPNQFELRVMVSASARAFN